MAFAEPFMAGPGAARRPWTRERVGALAAVALVHALLGFALLVGLGASVPVRVAEELKLIDVKLEPPPPPVVPKPRPVRPTSHRRAAAAAPPNLRSKATEIVAPVLKPPIPPPVIAAPKPALGMQAMQGAAAIAGPGTGAGGRGNGAGSGLGGNGDGGGEPARLISPTLSVSDLSTQANVALDRMARAEVGMRMTIGTNGRVTDCVVTRSSGSAPIDESTCRQAIKRLRYKPATDRAGRRIVSIIPGVQSWYATDTTPPEERPDAGAPPHG